MQGSIVLESVLVPEVLCMWAISTNRAALPSSWYFLIKDAEFAAARAIFLEQAPD
jgi:hypothetical protein